jgi:hypothetical protein
VWDPEGQTLSHDPEQIESWEREITECAVSLPRVGRYLLKEISYHIPLRRQVREFGVQTTLMLQAYTELASRVMASAASASTA